MKQFFCSTALALSLAVLPAPVALADDISYAEILADPDNAKLNERFAQQRLAQGDAKAALAAVERVLVADPTNLGARLFRAEILAALGADLQALGELRALRALPLPDAERRRIRTLIRGLKKRQKKVTTQVTASVGYLRNDNASGWPEEGTVLYNGAPLPDANPYSQDRIDDGDPITDETADEATAYGFGGTVTRDLGSETLRNAFVSFGHNGNTGGDTGYLDNTTNSLSLGLTYQRGSLTLLPRLSLADIDNDFDDRLGSYQIHAGGLNAQYQLSQKQRLTGSLGGTRLLYEGDKSSNDTLTLSGALGYQLMLGKGTVISLGLFHQNTDSDENNDLDKQTSGAQLALRVPVMRGHFVSLNGSYLESEHDNNYSQSFNPSEGETLADGTQREDETTGFGVSYTVLGGSVHAALANVFFTAASQVNDTESNLTGFSTKRNVTSLRVNYAFSF